MPEKAKAKAATSGSETDVSSDTLNTTPSSAPAPGEEEIAERAYSYWEARGCNGGSAEEDWYRAIEELAHEQDT